MKSSVPETLRFRPKKHKFKDSQLQTICQWGEQRLASKKQRCLKRDIFFTVLAFKALMIVLVRKKNVFGTAEGRALSGNQTS